MGSQFYLCFHLIPLSSSYIFSKSWGLLSVVIFSCVLGLAGGICCTATQDEDRNKCTGEAKNIRALMRKERYHFCSFLPQYLVADTTCQDTQNICWNINVFQRYKNRSLHQQQNLLFAVSYVTQSKENFLFLCGFNYQAWPENCSVNFYSII